jgi:hypothetical protein
MFHDVSSFSIPYVISRLFNILNISTINVIFKSKSLPYTNYSFFIKQIFNILFKSISGFLKDVG